MSDFASKGSFISGNFVALSGEEITSRNPAKNFEKVFTAHSNMSHVALATQAAKNAFVPWFSLSQEQRNVCLMRLKDAFVKHEQEMARAITLEMGKPISESETEAKNLSARIELMIKHGLARVATEKVSGLRGEARYHAQGPVAVLGPYNFPAHLVNAHVIPALLTGNTVVVKPSDVCPLVAQVYAECVHEVGLPAGVFNMIQGRADVGKALIEDAHSRAVLFTGSYATGRAISETLLDHPNKIAALEMGGKNIAVVLNDADLYQALSEILQGAFLTTGQRCTATSRVFLQRSIADRMITSLTRATRALKPSDPFDKHCAFGPLATEQSLKRYVSLLERAGESAEVILKGEVLGSGAFVTPSLHLLKESAKDSAYLKEELFGPDICIEIVEDLDDAIERTNRSAYGLSNALFSASQSAFEKFYRETSSGVLNFNRSTNGALGQLPFGGVGKSGNQRAAGIDAVRYSTFPVAINYLPYGETEPVSPFKSSLRAEQESLDISVEQLIARHRLESFLTLRGIAIHDARGPSVLIARAKLTELHLVTHEVVSALNPYAHVDDEYLWVTTSADAGFAELTEKYFDEVASKNATELSRLPRAEVQVPAHATLPQSEAMLNRLYKDNFVPREKKTPVIDLKRSKGPYLCSIDDDPLIIFDAASQIASLGAGFQAGAFLDALDTDQLTDSIIANPQKSESIDRYSKFLLGHAWSGLNHVTFTSSGAEANEKAFDLCRVNGTKGRRIIAFEGSFHGRTLMALQATFNPQKRGLFEFAGYEATFVPFPSWLDPREEPAFSPEWLREWHDRKMHTAASGDELLAKEIASLLRVKEEIEKGDVACVIIEPMQCEGGDNYATARFFNALRALTRGLHVPLIFDEVQTGFGLLGPFFAHSAFNLRDVNGNIDGPDCISMAKKAQLGVVLSTWPDHRSQPCHMLQVERGLLHAKALEHFSTKDLHSGVVDRLHKLMSEYPGIVSSTRAKGYAFAFDLPNAHVANELISQRFYRGYMVYVAGERTMRFRLNTKTTTNELDQLFAGISRSFDDVKKHLEQRRDLATYKSPAWVAGDTPKEKTMPSGDFSFLKLTLESFDKYRAQIAKLEEEVYEPGRRDTMDYLRGFVALEDGVALLMLDRKENVMGYAIGGPLEHSHVDGPKQDPMRGKNKAFYSTNVLVAPKYRGQKLGYALKKAQIDHVRALKRSDGSSRYDYLCGRNRIGFTSEMGAINRLFGAHTVKIYDRQYDDDNGRALYYRVNLRGPKLKLTKPERTTLDWSSSIQSPFGNCPDGLFEDLANGHFTTAVGTKLTLSNFVTPDFVRYAELLRQLAPKACKHAYFTSGRDEVNDKAIRCLRVSRPKGQVVIGLRQQFLGTTTAVSRSLTEPSAYAEPFSWFNWPLAEHPAQSSVKDSIASINGLVAQHGAENVLGFVVELMGEKTGHALSPEFLVELDQVRRTTGIPIAFVETASALGRNGQSLFFADSHPIAPNLVLWYAGAQLGHLFTDDQYYVSKPLTLISTWDGDEISIRRTYRHLLLAREVLQAGLATRFDALLRSHNLSERVLGKGLWRSVNANIVEQARERGLVLASGFDGRTMVTPHLGSTPQELERGVAILKEIL
jgi:acyl-CoA reductase-like NAD-dependent aldehyde dehydrogenase/4-aminobutyrate aminotransferase-like enzyme/GNAT superfamily N-acetyltransferase